ncbi:MAG TPA: CsbD family protein [Paucimonas sp.]|nr:CsbD family protein [Paucimonas sp.]
MNRDQIRGGLKDAAGKFQRKFGQLFGSGKQEMQGTETQAEGKTQKTVGNVTDTLDRAADSVKDTFKKQK